MIVAARELINFRISKMGVSICVENFEKYSW